MSIAHSHASGRPTASITTSLPRFSGEITRTASTASFTLVICTTSCAPIRLAAATWESRLTTEITLQPVALATCTNISPIGPPPITVTVSPISTLVSCSPRKQRRRDDHARVVATLIDLQVGSAGQRDLHFDQYFPVTYAGNRHFFNLQILFAIEDCCCHLTVHARLPSPEPPG